MFWLVARSAHCYLTCRPTQNAQCIRRCIQIRVFRRSEPIHEYKSTSTSSDLTVFLLYLIQHIDSSPKHLVEPPELIE